MDSRSPVDLGPSEQVLEVDALRDTVGELVLRSQRSLEQAQRFAANAAHELRTPLTSVRAELELLSESMRPEPESPEGDLARSMREDVLRAQATLTELGVLVDRLLVLSVPALAPNDGHELVSLRDLFEDAVADLPPAERARVSVSEADALVAGDAVLLGLLASNVLSNALKFGAAVSVSVHPSGPDVTLHVDDDGPGVDPAEREQVFEPFFRTPEALRRRLPGHGLGLALVRHVARMHRGDARFVDAPGVGARLEVRLPIADGAAG